MIWNDFKLIKPEHNVDCLVLLSTGEIFRAKYMFAQLMQPVYGVMNNVHAQKYEPFGKPDSYFIPHGEAFTPVFSDIQNHVAKWMKLEL